MKYTIEYLGNLIILLIITVFQVRESFPDLLPFSMPGPDSTAGFVLIMLMLIVSALTKQNQPGTYAQARTRWWFRTWAYLYLFAALLGLPLLSAGLHDDGIVSSAWMWLVWIALIVSQVWEWRKLRERKNSPPLEHPFLK